MMGGGRGRGEGSRGGEWKGGSAGPGYLWVRAEFGIEILSIR
jgi:hypothetical protein